MIPLGVLGASHVAAAGGWSPSSLSGLALWLDAEDSTTITQSGGYVSQWNDKSGHGRHFTQSGADSIKPLTGGSVGTGAALIMGARYLSASLTTIASQPLTIAMAVKTVTYEANVNLIDARSGRVLVEAAIGARWRVYAGGLLDRTPSPSAGTSYALVAIISGASSLIRTNGAQVGAAGFAGTSSLGSSSPNTVYVGRGNDAVGGENHIGEVIVCAGALSGGDLTNLESYLMTKWGLS